ncbi:MAG TPA: hypothetical protein VHC46_09830, partial [Thermodesulfobacteriota bacterium]|nr:hypothetical protein [Thermodesulfobacteriota bacterium]
VDEDRLDRELIWFFEKNGIAYSDARPYVIKEVYKSINAYSPTDDGHPLEAGYEAYARAAYDAMNANKSREQGRLDSEP